MPTRIYQSLLNVQALGLIYSPKRYCNIYTHLEICMQLELVTNLQTFTALLMRPYRLDYGLKLSVTQTLKDKRLLRNKC